MSPRAVTTPNPDGWRASRRVKMAVARPAAPAPTIATSQEEGRSRVKRRSLPWNTADVSVGRGGQVERPARRVFGRGALQKRLMQSVEQQFIRPVLRVRSEQHGRVRILEVCDWVRLAGQIVEVESPADDVPG